MENRLVHIPPLPTALGFDVFLGGCIIQKSIASNPNASNHHPNAKSCRTESGWWFEPLWKIWSQLGWLFPIYDGKIKLMFQTTNQELNSNIRLDVISWFGPGPPEKMSCVSHWHVRYFRAITCVFPTFTRTKHLAWWRPFQPVLEINNYENWSVEFSEKIPRTSSFSIF